VGVEVRLDETTALLRTVRAAADVLEVEEGGGFCASVYLGAGDVAVARLDRSLQGANYEGAVLRRVLEHCAGVHGPGYFEFRLAT